MKCHLCAAGMLLLMLLSAFNAHQRKANIKSQPKLKNHPTPLTSKAARHVNLGRSAVAGSRATKSGASCSPDLVTLKAAKVATFYFANDTLEQQLKHSGQYDSESVLPYDVTVDAESRDRMFVTTPAMRRGIPVSLSTVPHDGAANSPLTPYPSLDLHRTSEDAVTDCTAQIVSVISTTVALPGRLSGPNGPLAVDPDGQRVSFSLEDDLAIYCWNTSKEHDPQNFHAVAQDDNRLQYISSLKIDSASQRMYIQSNRFTKYLSNTSDYYEDNYYIMYLPIGDIKC